MINTINWSPILISTNKKGTNKYWQAFIFQNGEDFNSVYILRKYWQDTKEGLSQVTCSVPQYVTPKNVGKSNETGILVQAELELKALVKKQLDKGYYIQGQEPQLTVLPMLAHDYKKHGQKLLNKVVIVQPKLDGIRCLYHRDIGLYSRKGKPFIKAVQDLFDFSNSQGNIVLDGNIILDGELILPHNKYTFQQTVSAIKKKGELTQHLKYVVYDCVDLNRPQLTYRDRLKLIADLHLHLPFELISNYQTELKSIDQIQTIHEMYCLSGYEGSMIRLFESPYEINNRSYSLLKYKDFMMDEFYIVDVEAEIVDDQQTKAAIFVCQTEDKKLFNVRMKASVEDRIQMYENAADLVGCMLTVQYQGLTDRGIPRFPVGIEIRDYE